MSISTATAVTLLDVRAGSGAITLPLTTEIPYRVFTVKDSYGIANVSSVIINTQGTDVFENGQSTITLTNSFDTMTFYAGQPGYWYTIGGSRLAAAAIGSLSTGLIQNSLRLGTLSTLTSIQFPGLRAGYTGTAIAEQTTGLGTQELLLYKASSISDQIRLQTTGNIVFEAGVTSRSWPSTTAQATPTLFIASSSNIGIQTASPAFPLDVAGTARVQTLSTLGLNVSSINGTVYGAFAGSTTFLSSAVANISSITAMNVTSMSTTVGRTQTFTPKSILGLQMWLDASDPTTFTYSSGSTISLWLDKSGQGYHASNSGSVYTSTNSVVFSGNTLQTYLTASGMASNVFQEYGFIVFTTANTTQMSLIGGNYYSSRGIIIQNGSTGTGGSSSIYNVNNGGDYIATITNASWANNAPQMVDWSSGGYLGFNASTIVNSGSNYTNYIGPWGQRFSILGGGNPGYTALTGTINEVVIYQGVTLSSNDIYAVEGYLAAKWNIKANLPATHLYKTVDIRTSTVTTFDAFITGTDTNNVAILPNQYQSRASNIYPYTTPKTQLLGHVDSRQTIQYLTLMNTGCQYYLTTATFGTLFKFPSTWAAGGYYLSFPVYYSSNDAGGYWDFHNQTNSNITITVTNGGALGNFPMAPYAMARVTWTGYSNVLTQTTQWPTILTQDLANNRLGLNNTPSYTFDVTGTSRFTSNVGIGTVPLATSNLLDVGGVARAQVISTLGLNVSSINGTVYGSFAGSTTYLSASVTSISTLTMNTATTSTLTVVQNGTMASLLLASNGSAAPTTYGVGADTLTVQTTNASYTGGIASMAFATATASYPLARIYAVDSANSGPAVSQLVFQTVPLSATSFSSNYSYTGANQTFTVPAGVTTISVIMWGAGGGGSGSRGGAGAYINGTLSVTPGQVLTLVVGQGGLPGAGGGTATMYGGGGNVPNNNTYCGAGGGRSAIQTTLIPTITSAVGTGTSVTYTTSAAHGLVVNQPVIISGLTPSGYNGTFAVTSTGSTTFVVANTTTGTSSGSGTIVAELVDVGGGGGSADSSPSQGGNATYSGTAATGLLSITGTGGVGGSQTAGGAGGTGGNNGSGSTGSLLKGGSSSYRAGGGGGGYYGGGGGSGGDPGGSGGGGGSSYTSNPTFTLITGSNSADGYTAPATAVSGYQTGVAAGGTTGGGTGGAGLILLASVGNAYTEAMRIGTTGNVGIGTSAPGALLDVGGVARAQTISSLVMNASTATLSGSLNMSYNNVSSVGIMSFSKFSATNLNATAGGTYTTYTSSSTTYALHAFTTVGTTTFSPLATITGANVLIVGGGGGGGQWIGGGGGGGYVTALTNQTITAGTYSIVVGAGGGGIYSSGGNGVNGSNGGASSAFGSTANGGGGGQSINGPSPGTGGGGYGAAGSASGGYGAGLTNVPVGCNGGNGVQNGITGSILYYAGGGGGSAYSSGGQGTGGLGGGSAGANQPDGTSATNATFYGGGGGGATRPNPTVTAGSGYQGVVYVLYTLAGPSGVSIGTFSSDALLNFTISPANSALRLQGPTEWRSITNSTAASSVDLTSAGAYFATTYRLSAAGSIAITFPTLTVGGWWVFTNATAATQTLTTTGTTTGLAASYSLQPATSITFYSDGNSYYTSTTGSTSGTQTASFQTLTF